MWSHNQNGKFYKKKREFEFKNERDLKILEKTEMEYLLIIAVVVILVFCLAVMPNFTRNITKNVEYIDKKLDRAVLKHKRKEKKRKLKKKASRLWKRIRGKSH